MTFSQLPHDLAAWILPLAATLDARQQQRFLALLTGALFARGRRTVTSWLRAAGITDDFRPCYYLLSSLARQVDEMARLLLLRIALPRVGARCDRLLFALDDTPTKRYGPCVEGAGLHHNPTPGPAGPKFVYGHVWVTLAWVVPHRLWGAIALPLLARLYVRQKDIGPLRQWYGWPFRTKLELAAELVQWLARWTSWLHKPLWLVCDGAYAKRELLRAARTAKVVVVSRLRKDAALRTLPSPRRAGQRGRPAIYGPERIELAKRAGQKRGWRREEMTLYGDEIVKVYKTFLATWRPAGGVIRVVLVKEPTSWRAYFSTDVAASASDILEAIADRFTIEQVFKDVKEIWGAGQQQLRNLWANIGAWHVNLWLHTLVEVWAWDRPAGRLVDRSACPWDDRTRRPSHADRRKALQRECLWQEYRAAVRRYGRAAKIVRLLRRLLGMAT
jgi:DDE superfamily endonuclease